MYELAKRLNDGGDAVSVLTAFPNYPTGVIPEGYRGRFSMEERIGGVRVLRRWVFATPNAGFFRRIVNQFSFALSSLTATRKLGPVDVIFVQSPPLPIAIAALMLSRLKGAPFVFNVSDVWPQSAIELGMLRNPVAIRLAEWLERHTYKRAARVTVPTPGILEGLVRRGIPREKLFWLTNGVDVEVFQPQNPDRDLANKLGVDGRKVFLYAGTHGLSQGLGVILEAARLTADTDILYVLVGEGADKAALLKKAKADGLTNVRFLPSQPKASMPALLNLAYAAVITLKPLDVFRSALPSKMFESMAVAQPIVASVWGEAADLVTAAGCGIVTPPGDPMALRDAVLALAADPARAKAMGARGRDYVTEHYNRQKIAASLRELLVEVTRRQSVDKLVRVITRMNVGGPSRHVTILSVRCAPEFDTALLAGETDSREGSLEGEALAAGAHIVHVPRLRRPPSPIDDVLALIWLYRYFRREKPAIVATHLAKAGTAGRLAAWLARVPIRIHTFHGHVLDGYFGGASSAFFTWLERMLGRISTRLIAVSPEVAADLERLRIGRGKTVVVRLGLELERLAGNPGGVLRKELGIAQESPMIGIVGRLVPIKAHDLFLDAAEQVANLDPNAAFVIVGDGELWDELHRQVESRGLAKRVHFTGWRSDLDAVYSDLDVVVCCSKNEGTPVSLIEAGAAGRPVIGTRVGGMPDIITAGVNGLLVPSGDAGALAASIVELLGDPGRREAMGAAGQRMALDRYGADRMVNELKDLYRTLLANERLSPEPAS